MAQAVNVNGMLSYLASDSLGSVMVALDNAGNVTASQLYFPYGDVRYATGTMPTSFGFTGQRLDPSGLMYFHARYYNPTVGQFTSADVFQGPNRYAYVGNNPSSSTAPSSNGVTPTQPLVDGCGATGATYCTSPLRARPLSAPASWSTPCDLACVASAMVTGLDAIVAPFTYAAQASQALGAPQWVVDALYGLADLTGEPVPVGQQLFDLAMWLSSLSSAAGGGASGIGAAIGAAANAALSSGMLHAMGVNPDQTGGTTGNDQTGGGASGGNQVQKGTSKTTQPIYRFGGSPNGPKPGVKPVTPGGDIMVQPNGNVSSQSSTAPPWPEGASTYLDPQIAPYTGFYYMLQPDDLPNGLPNGLRYMRDGSEVGGPHSKGHGTLYPTQDMPFDQFNQLVLGLPWKYAGRKP